MTVSAAVAVLAGAAGGGAAAAVAGSVVAGSAGSATFSMIGSVQRFALSAGVSANLSDMYRGAACGLQWSNLQLSILGSGTRPACKDFTYNNPPTTSTGRRLSSWAPSGDPFDGDLMVHHREEEGWSGISARRLLADVLELNSALYRRIHLRVFSREEPLGAGQRHGYDEPAGVSLRRRHLLGGSSGDVSQVALQAYERLLIILIIFGSALLLHWTTLRMWGSVG